MKYSIRCLLWLLIATTQVFFANDGAYYASGNHLVPITDADIAVTKEILKVTRYKEEFLSVDVYYEFYNHGNDKKVLVGFEAPSPSGDVDGYPINGKHPYISRFSVEMNTVNLSYKTAIVSDSLYYKNGEILAKTENEVIGSDFNTNDPEFYYVYHFNANFKKGKNLIRHKYIFKLSGSVMDKYSFDYILTAANRWSNKQIDDFTLIVDMGNEASFSINKSFYSGNEDWEITGKGLKSFNKEREFTDFYIEEGSLTFHKKNFVSKDELYISSSRNFQYCQKEEFDAQECTIIPFDISFQEKLQDVKDEKSYKILRNLPYARRGYVFKTDFIQAYYQKQSWYTKNPTYVAELEPLTKAEKNWLKFLKANVSF
ncbi:YARHG domain-containing protein [Aquimarina algiphila]|uniref:YARHG domain-containing protein n=1 Tax=Aquimarina algiphila TaxID=2047982 RepID=UPI002493BBC6|nr:YARHG domain-containing protein [Aquimarina algiphila]